MGKAPRPQAAIERVETKVQIIDSTSAHWHVFHIAVPVLMAVQVGLLARSSYVHSPTDLEVFHLPAGVSHLELSSYDLCRVNPPLVRWCAALPCVAAGFNPSYKSYTRDPLHRCEYSVGVDAMYANGSRFVWLVTLARWACIPFTLLGSLVCFIWAKQLYGRAAGIFVLLMWCFSPYVLAHGSLLTPDAHSAGMGVAASYLFWRCVKEPRWKTSVLVGAVLGLAELTKFTLVIFYPLWLVTWGVYRFSDPNHRKARVMLRDCGMIFTIFATSVFVVNWGYEFEESFKPLGEYHFQSSLLTGAESPERIPESGGNRYTGTWLAGLPIPLPANYVQGIDTQTVDLETGIGSYLRGKWQTGGWSYFYLYALGVKLPLGTWILVLLAIGGSALSMVHGASWRDEILLLAPAVLLIILLSTQSGIGIHSRYALPALPFVFIWSAKVASVFRERPRGFAWIVLFSLSWSVGSSLYCYPHSLSYFNELVGGPRHGHEHLAKSDSSWGQDLLSMKKWQDDHPQVGVLRLAHCGPFDPRLAGLRFALPPVGPRMQDHPNTISIGQLGAKPGWYAINVGFLLAGAPLPAARGQGGWEQPSKTPGYDLSYFARFEPVDTAGYSIYIYHITLDEANHVRKELGLPELP